MSEKSCRRIKERLTIGLKQKKINLIIFKSFYRIEFLSEFLLEKIKCSTEEMC